MRLAIDHRRLIGRLCTVFAMAQLLCTPALAADALVRSVDSIGIPVVDASRSKEFYSSVLGFRSVSDREVSGDAYAHLFGVFGLRLRLVRMQLGDEFIELMQFVTPAGRALPEDFRSNDRIFEHICIVVSDMDKAFGALRASGVHFASPGPQTLPAWNPNAAGITAFYFKDPDGNNLEALHFPPDKGASKWHRSSKAVFLGIDHTAIVIGRTRDSLSYYRDFLGMNVTGTSDNFGPEQELLNNVFGARLHITSLRAASGPGVELLEYVTPSTGRPYPKDTVASDHWQWLVTMQVPVGTELSTINHIEEQSWVSSTPIRLEGNELGYQQAFIMRDPDGHATNLIVRATTDRP